MIGYSKYSHQRGRSFALGHETAKFSRQDQRSMPPQYNEASRNQRYNNPSLTSVLFRDRDAVDKYTTTTKMAFEGASAQKVTPRQQPERDDNPYTSQIFAPSERKHSHARYKKKPPQGAHLETSPYKTEYSCRYKKTPVRNNYVAEERQVQEVKLQQENPTPTNVRKSSQRVEIVQIAESEQRQVTESRTETEPKTRQRNEQVQAIKYTESKTQNTEQDGRPASPRQGEPINYKSTIYEKKNKLDFFGGSHFSPYKEKVIYNDEKIDKHYNMNQGSPYKNTYGKDRPIIEDTNRSIDGYNRDYASKKNQMLENEEKDYLGDLGYQKQMVRENYEDRQRRVRAISDTNVALHNSKSGTEYLLKHGNAPIECQKLDKEYDEDIKDKKSRYLDYLKHQADLDVLKAKISVQKEREIERGHTGLVQQFTPNDYNRRNERLEVLMKQYEAKEQMLEDIQETNYRPDGNYQIHQENYYDQYVSKQHQRKKDNVMDPEYKCEIRSLIKQRQQNRESVTSVEKQNDTRLINDQVEWVTRCMKEEKQRKHDQQRDLNDGLKNQITYKNNKNSARIKCLEGEAPSYTAKYIDRFNYKNCDQRGQMEYNRQSKARKDASERVEDRNLMNNMVQYDRDFMRGQIEREKSAKKETANALERQIQNKDDRVLY